MQRGFSVFSRVLFCFLLSAPALLAEPTNNAVTLGRRLAEAVALIRPEAVERSIAHLETTYPQRYDGAAARRALTAFRTEETFLRGISDKSAETDIARAEPLVAGIRTALLANPLLDADRLVFVRRIVGADKAKSTSSRTWGSISLNSHTHVTIDRAGWKSELVELTGLRGNPTSRVIRAFDGPPVRDLELSYDADHLTFTGIDENKRFAVYDLPLTGGEPRRISPKAFPDVDWYDAVPLPDGRLIMLSTASYQGLPCENGSRPMAQVYQVDPATDKVRQLTFDQDSDYTPAVMNDGKVLYTRWEYSDLPHYFSRILMTMNPDGTSQLALWGSGSYFPTTLLQVRPIPGETSKLVGIVSGHHDVQEIGRLVLLDPTLARGYPFKPILSGKEWGPEGSTIRIQTQRLPPEKTGMLQEIPGWGESVEADVCDGQAGNQHERGRPFFVYPFPLSAQFHLVTARPPKSHLWGIYLVDTFDNATLLHELEDSALLEPLLVQPRPQPRTIPDRITPAATNATVHIADIYQGSGLVGVPRGTVKKLRLFSYHFNYLKTGGHASVGIESGWDIKRLLGTVDLEADGSACFEIPANTTISIQPLDADGASLQLMRSWLTGMPGERVSCTGCHEDNRTSVRTGFLQADKHPPQKIKPWHGPTRPMTFELEVWPQLQTSCVGCHDAKSPRPMTHPRQAYETIHPYVRRPGPESELPTYLPMAWHVSTSPLFQMLRKGHHGVKPTAEFYERLAAWTDLNAPWRGNWTPKAWEGQDQHARRLELARAFGQCPADGEAEYAQAVETARTLPTPVFVKPPPQAAIVPDTLTAPAFPQTPEQAAARQQALGATTRELDLGNGRKMTFVRIPAGDFVMGSQTGYRDEQPRAVVAISKPFWMATTEVRNAVYAAFDPEHDSRYIDAHGKDHAVPGYIANHPDQPVSSVSWRQAAAFCAWLSKQHGVRASLPTEAQWEWAARAGSATPFFYGDGDTDFAPFANLADNDLQNFRIGWDGRSKIQKRLPYKPEQNYPLCDPRFKDNWFVVDYVARCRPNAWGLHDMVGNVNEWTRSDYAPYPYAENDGRNAGDPATKKVARGGSWACRPRDAGSSVRFAYESWQPVHDVGFRVIIEE